MMTLLDKFNEYGIEIINTPDETIEGLKQCPEGSLVYRKMLAILQQINQLHNLIPYDVPMDLDRIVWDSFDVIYFG